MSASLGYNSLYITTLPIQQLYSETLLLEMVYLSLKAHVIVFEVLWRVWSKSTLNGKWGDIAVSPHTKI